MISLLAEVIRSLVAEGVRTILTLMGLVIGVAAVISIQVAGAGLNQAAYSILGTLNDREFIIYPAQQTDYDRAAVRLEDLVALKRQVPSLLEAIPAGNHIDVVRRGHVNARLNISPDSANSFEVAPLQQGRPITSADVALATSVCVLSNKAYTRLFPMGGTAIGSSVYVGSYRFLIIGVEAPTRSGFINMNFSGDINVPYTTYIHRYIAGDVLYAARFLAAKDASLSDIEDATMKALRTLHTSAHDPQYTKFDKGTLSSKLDGILFVITSVTSLVASISFIVAGVGIMNIMLVSVIERTREIGIRRAIGASRRHILFQFLLEALVISISGSAIGLVVGTTVGAVLNRLLLTFLKDNSVAIPWFQIITSTAAFAMFVTVAFGIYPAYRAASVDPIDALRR